MTNTEQSAGVTRTGLRDDHYSLVLHSLRVKGSAEPPTVADFTCLEVDEVEAHLASGVEQDHVQARKGPVQGYGLTTPGRQHHGSWITGQLDRFGVRGQAQDAYGRFVEVNERLKVTCTAWQLKNTGGEPVLNDHSDEKYDRGVIRRLHDVHRAVEPICSSLASAIDRFDVYGRRLARALAKIDEGEHAWFTSPMLDSYHTVWFELHEDQILTLGLDRNNEGA